MGIAFRVIPSLYKEGRENRGAPSRLVMKHALGKARGARIPDRTHYVLAADTVVYCRGLILGKPRTKAEAVAMLSKLSGRVHYVYTGVALGHPLSGKYCVDYVKTQVRFRKLSRDEILSYLKRIHPFDKAGSYAIQEGADMVESVKGSYTNVLGLPEEWLMKKIRNFPEFIK
jgi:septum formation protein